MFPETSRDAPAPTPQRIAASAAACAHARVVGEAEVVVRAEQQHRPAVEHHARPLRAADHPHAGGSRPRRRSASSRSCDVGACRAARSAGRMRREPAFGAPSGRRRHGSSWRTRSWVEGSQKFGLGLAVDQARRSASRRLALEPAAAVVGPRVGAVVGLAGDVEPELREHRAVLRGLGAEGGQEVAHHHPVEPGLDRERLQLVEVLDPAAAEPEERVGEDQAEDRDPLHGLPRVHQLAVAELRPGRGLSRLIGTESGRSRRARTPSRPAGAASPRG